jgi:hypothetical protein
MSENQPVFFEDSSLKLLKQVPGMLDRTAVYEVAAFLFFVNQNIRKV